MHFFYLRVQEQVFEEISKSYQPLKSQNASWAHLKEQQQASLAS